MATPKDHMSPADCFGRAEAALMRAEETTVPEARKAFLEIGREWRTLGEMLLAAAEGQQGWAGVEPIPGE
jgi:hypothetical protein